MLSRVALALAASALLLVPVRVDGHRSDDGAVAETADVRAALTRFLTAFENLDWNTFRAAFASDASVFFPTPEPASRFDGRDAVEARFHEVFDAIRASNPGGPPFHRLAPEDLRIDLLGPDAAVVTFQLRNAERLARRTIVFRRTPRGWLIAHLHASNVAGS